MYYFLIFLIMFMMSGIIIVIVEGELIFSKIRYKKTFVTVYISLLIVILLVYSIFYYTPQDINQALIKDNSYYSNKTLLSVFSNAEARGVYLDRLNHNR